MNINDIIGGQSRVSSLIGYMRSSGVGVGGPDTSPSCINDNCDLGYVDPHSIWSYNSMIGNLTGGGVRASGLIPIAMGVEASELGLNAFGQPGGYTPAEIFDFFESQLQGSHVFWHRNDQYGTSEQQWATGFLPLINANPTVANNDCPATYLSGCNAN